MKKVIYSFIILVLGFLNLKAQDEVNKCGWYEAQELLIDGDEQLRQEIELNEMHFNAEVNNFNFSMKMTPDTVIIPIVFHVIHNYGSENVSDQVIYEALEQLNTDLMAQNEDLDQVSESFVDVIGNPQIEFRLAKNDQYGNCHSGITRTVSTLTYSGTDEVKELVMWPRNKYLNVWITKTALNGQAGGYTYKPNAVHNYPGIDGIIVRAAQFGAGERTLTHEVGHWLNLSHTWGNTNEPGLSTNCDDDDAVSDTPNTIGHSSGCNINATTCGSLDNIQNYMDYSSCDRMFTVGQANRMIVACNSYLAQRNQLWTTSNLEAAGVLEEPELCAADFDANEKRICAGDEVEFSNMSYHGDTEWTWEFEGGEPSQSNDENPIVTYSEPGIYQVSLSVSNGTDTVSEIKETFIHVLPTIGNATPFVEGFENASDFPNDDWTVNNYISSYTWSVTNSASTSGNKSVFLNNHGQEEGLKAELESNPIDLSGLDDVVITFKYAYAKRLSSNDDILKVKVTKNCGTTWIAKETLKASDGTLTTASNHYTPFTPEDNEWEEAYIDNISSLYLIENFRMKFEFTSGNGNNVYIDDINIYDPATVGINEVNKSALKFEVFPNPVSDQLTLSFNLLKATDVNAEVYDLSGRKVQTLFDQNYPVGKSRIDIPTGDWNSGVYLIRLSIEGEHFIERVIKR